MKLLQLRIKVLTRFGYIRLALAAGFWVAIPNNWAFFSLNLTLAVLVLVVGGKVFIMAISG